MKSMHNSISSVQLKNFFYEKKSFDIYMMSLRASDNIRQKVYFISNVAYKVKYKIKCEVNGNTKQI